MRHNAVDVRMSCAASTTRGVLRTLAAGILMLALAACAGGQTVTALYSIEAPATPAALRGRTSAQILIAEPRALQALDTAQIAVRPTEDTLSYYGGVAWADTAPKILQSLLLATFQNADRVRAVGLPGQSLLIDYQIVTEVRAFQVETFGANRARVEVAAKLLDDRVGRVVASRVFEAVVPVASDEVGAAAAGVNAAAQQVATEILQWTLSTI